MKYTPLSTDFYLENRQKLSNQLLDNSFLILYAPPEYPRNGDQFFPFRQNSDLYFLSGIDQEETALLMVKDTAAFGVKTSLYIKKTDKNQEIWFGKKLSLEAAAKISGIEVVFYKDDLEKHLEVYARQYGTVYLWEPDLPKYDNKALEADPNLKAKKHPLLAKLHQEALFPHTQALRLIKHKEEIRAMQKAISITHQAYKGVLGCLKPGMFEYEIEAEITYQFLKHGAQGHAYAPIVAGGYNASILHYVDNDSLLQDGDLLLMDFGAEYGNYAADCSRTIPINGKFSNRQRACYQAVLDVYKRVIQLFVPGNTIAAINKQVGQWMQEKMLLLDLLTQEEIDQYLGEQAPYFKYFMHGTSHFIGLDVHDVGTKETPFEKGMVLTCEPGLYIPEENLGIRIETNVLVDDYPVDLMADFPVEIDEIEDLMKPRIS